MCAQSSGRRARGAITASADKRRPTDDDPPKASLPRRPSLALGVVATRALLADASVRCVAETDTAAREERESVCACATTEEDALEVRLDIREAHRVKADVADHGAVELRRALQERQALTDRRRHAVVRVARGRPSGREGARGGARESVGARREPCDRIEAAAAGERRGSGS